MHDVARIVLHLNMWDLQRGHRLERQRERLVDLLSASRMLHVFSNPAQRAKNLCSIKSLPFAMFAKTHNWTSSPPS